MTNYNQLANLAQNAYLLNNQYGSTLPTGYNPVIQAYDTNFWQNGTGFTAHSFYSAADNTLVVSFAGTGDRLDFLTDAQLAIVGYSNQDNLALNFASTAIDQLNTNGIRDFNVVYTGHSLGGYLAQVAAAQNPNASAVVFNAPGTGGILENAAQNENVTYIFSDPRTWSFVDRNIHQTGGLASDNVLFLLGSEGHGLDSISEAFSWTVPITSEQWANVIAEGLQNGDFTVQDLAPLLSAGDIGADSIGQVVRNGIAQGIIEGGGGCFLAGTMIDMWPLDPDLKPDANGNYDEAEVLAKVWRKPIEQIAEEDIVVSPDENGLLKPGRVTRTMIHHAKYILDFHGLKMTPGHATFCAEGKFAGQTCPNHGYLAL